MVTTRLGPPASSRAGGGYSRRRETRDLLAQLDITRRPLCSRYIETGLQITDVSAPAPDQPAPVMRTSCVSGGVISSKYRHSFEKRSDSRSDRRVPRVLQPCVSSEEERFGKNANDSQYGIVQSTLPASAAVVQVNEFSSAQGQGRSGGVVGQSGYSGRLPACPYFPGTQEISPFHVSRSTFPMVCSPVWNIMGPVVVCPNYVTNNQVPSPEGGPVRTLLRRLHNEQHGSSVASQTDRSHETIDETTRLVYQRGEISSVPVTLSAIHRRSVSDRVGQVDGPSRQMGEDLCSRSHGVDPCVVTPRVAGAVGSVDLCPGPHTQRSPDVETFTEVSGAIRRQKRFEGEISSPGSPARISEVVDSPIECLRRRLFIRAGTGQRVVCRRISPGVGSSPGGSDGIRPMVSVADQVAYKQSGVSGSYFGRRALGKRPTRLLSSGGVRQLHGCVVRQEPGVNEVTETVRSDLQIFSPDGSSQDRSEDSSHTRVFEHSSRRSVSSGETSADRVDAPQGGVSSDLRAVPLSAPRSVCNKSQLPPSTVCVPSTRPRSSRSGCLVSVMGGSRRVCVSPSSSHDEGRSKDKGNEEDSSAFGRALVARQGLVSRSSRVSNKRSNSAPRQTRHSATPAQSLSPSRPGQVSSARVGYMQGALRSKGYSHAAAMIISNAHRSSTKGLYDDKWKSFEVFCRGKQVDPLGVSPQFVAEFFLYLRNTRKLKGGTIATYLVALNTVLAVRTGVKFSTVPELQAMLKAFKLEDQKKIFRSPAWDLNVVLTHLRGGPYEPLSDASFELLTKKTVFLLALATAARVSEIHALDVTRIKFENGRHGAVFLGLSWDFVAKNQLPGQPDRLFKIKPLSTVIGEEDEEELFLCPVRALKQYIKASETRRRNRKKLFIPISTASKKEASKNAVSFWLRSTILAAYEDRGLPPPSASNPHEIRALASTMALHRNCSVTSIMEGCFWRSNTVFATHYLRDLSVQDVEGLQSFGPLVVAQQLTRPRRR